jgi:HEPN domain-containing protein
MSKDEKALLVAREWALKGENDLKNAAHTLEMGKECPTDTVCFHAQQCVRRN